MVLTFLKIISSQKFRKKFRKMKRELYRRILEEKRSAALHQNGVEALDIIHKSFTKKQVVYWLYCGTLLGIIRDGNFIQNDTDIDIGIWYSPKKAIEVERILVTHGFTKNHEFRVGDQIFEQRFEYKGVGVDLYYFVKSATEVYESSFSKDKPGYYLVKACYSERDFRVMKTTQFKGVQTSVPQNYANVLSALYGDWQIPIKKKNFIPFQGPNRIHLRDKRATILFYAPSVHTVNKSWAFLRTMKDLNKKHKHARSSTP